MGEVITARKSLESIVAHIKVEVDVGYMNIRHHQQTEPLCRPRSKPRAEHIYRRDTVEDIPCEHDGAWFAFLALLAEGNRKKVVEQVIAIGIFRALSFRLAPFPRIPSATFITQAAMASTNDGNKYSSSSVQYQIGMFQTDRAQNVIAPDRKFPQ